MSRNILYPIDNCYKDVLNIICKYVEEESAHSNLYNNDDCTYYTFYHDDSGRGDGHIVVSMIIENDEVNLLVKVEGKELYQMFGDKKVPLFDHRNQKYKLTFADPKYQPIDFSLYIEKSHFDDIIKIFKEESGKEKKINRSPAEYLANKCRSFKMYKKEYSTCTYDNKYEDMSHEYFKYIEYKRGPNVSVYTKCVFASKEKITRKDKYADLFEKIKIKSEKRTYYDIPEKNRYFTVEMSFINKFQYCGKEICLNSRISMYNDLHSIMTKMRK